MINKPFTQKKIIEYLKKGWELGKGENRFWFQKKLCCGGENFAVHASSVWALKRKGIIECLPKRKDDSFWLTRFGLKKESIC